MDRVSAICVKEATPVLRKIQLPNPVYKASIRTRLMGPFARHVKSVVFRIIQEELVAKSVTRAGSSLQKLALNAMTVQLVFFQQSQRLKIVQFVQWDQNARTQHQAIYRALQDQCKH
jgi:hypothetical protein